MIDVAEIDRRCRDNGLNRLEQERAEYLIHRAPPAPPHRLRRREAVSPAARALAAARGARPRRARARRRRRRVDRRQGAARRAVGQDLRVATRPSSATSSSRRRRLHQRRRRARSCAPTSSATARLPPEARRSWPWDFARDLLGDDFDPWWDVPDDRAQLGLFSTPASAPSCSSSRAATAPAPAPAPPARCCDCWLRGAIGAAGAS